jgi:hypothetical protein
MGRKKCPVCKKVVPTYAYIKGWYFGWHTYTKYGKQLCPMAYKNSNSKAPESGKDGEQ